MNIRTRRVMLHRAVYSYKIPLLQVNSVINRMGLRGVADSRVGGAVVRGVSGGEKRRVTIALQLLKDPGKFFRNVFQVHFSLV